VQAVRSRHTDELAKLDNYHTGVVEGFIYILSNPAWPGYLKIGCAIDPINRCASYQTGSPLRDYQLEHYIYSADRKRLERRIHSALKQSRSATSEWFEVSLERAIQCLDQFADDEKNDPPESFSDE
jgi:hypothetical protein